jgi:hypothetical protein
MQKLPEKCCGTCKWGKFEMSNHNPPRILRGGRAECLFPLPEIPPMPSCVDPIRPYKRSIYDAMGTDCPTWAAKEGKMGKEVQC